MKYSVLLILAVLSWPLASAELGNIENIGPLINTAADEFSPSLTQDGSTLYFNSKRDSDRYMSIYRSTKQNNATFSKPQKVTEINSTYNDETPFISNDGKMILFASDRDGSTEMQRDANGVTRVSFDIYYAKLEKGKFSKPQRIMGGVNSPHNEKSPYLHSDGTLYFTRYPFGDISRAKIMRSKLLPSGLYGEPEDLPLEINSGHQENSLTGAPGGFYFSSKRPGSKGWDIYFISHTSATSDTSEKWGKAVRLAEPINSEKNDTFLSRLGNTLYFSSNREGGMGRFDIYAAKEPQPELNLQATVTDKTNGKPVQAKVALTAKVGEQRADLNKNTDDKGQFSLIVHPLVEAFEVKIEQPGYLPFYQEITRNEMQNGSPLKFELIKEEKNASFTVRAIHFDYNASSIKKASWPYLNSLADYLKRHPKMKLEVIGHTDMTGSDEFNLKLSQQRAEAVVKYLESKGVSHTRFKPVGMGKSSPWILETNEQADALNRRTEFKVLEN